MHINLPNRRVAGLLKQLLQAGLDAGDPLMAVQRIFLLEDDVLSIGTQHYDLTKVRKIIVVGAGKASAYMAMAIESILGKRVDSGLVVVKDGHTCPRRFIQMHEARHPLPDQRGMRAAQAIVRLITPLTPEDLLIVLISGGASSLLPLPASPLTLSDKQKTTDLLFHSGATIQEINIIRKHLSAIKGGQLAAITHATIISLILSDVLGDDLGTIGSGPTVADPTTFHNAKDILQRKQLWSRIPVSVQHHLERGIQGDIPETPGSDSSIFSMVQNELIGNNRMAITTLAQKAAQLGLHTKILTTTLQGEAKEAGKMAGTIAHDILHSEKSMNRPACIILGGELTVTIKRKGKGGRAQEFALSAAITIAGLPNVWIVGFGTDGTDGPTDVAGAIVGGQTMSRAQAMEINPLKFLAAHNSYAFFKKVGGHITTGPTGTNINDFYLLLIL